MGSKSITDAGVGRALFTTQIQLSLQAMRMCIGAAFLGLCVPMIGWFSSVPPHDLDIVKTHILATVVNPKTPQRWIVRDDDGNQAAVTVIKNDGSAAQYMTGEQVKQALEPYNAPVNTFYAILWTGVFIAICCYVITWVGLKRLGAGNQENQRLRGAQSLVSDSELNRLILKDKPSKYKLVDVALPASGPVSGILAMGAQRSGKSLAIHDLMQQVFQKKRKSIIYDQNGEFFRAYYRPGKDFFFNPACLGSVPWSIFEELKYSYDADTLAQAFLPPKAGVVNGGAAFFEDAARALFSVILLRLAERGASNTSDIAKAFLAMPDDEMEFIIRDSVASSAVGGDSKGQRQGVISSIAIYLNGIGAVQNGSWSIREFIESDDDARFFILGTEDTRAMFAPLFRLLLSVSFSLIAAKQEIVHGDKYWFFLDEVHELGDIKLDKQLATLGKFGVCVVSGIQSDSQFVSSMGKERSEIVMNCFNTVLMLRAGETNMQERMAKRLGRLEMDTVSRNQALAVTEWRDGAGLNKTEGEKWLVMPAELGDLAPCTGYIKMVGSFPAAFVDYKSWLPKWPGAKARVTKFNPIQPIPPRDPSFLITRVARADPLGSIKTDLANAKASEEVEGSPQSNSTNNIHLINNKSMVAEVEKIEPEIITRNVKPNLEVGL